MAKIIATMEGVNGGLSDCLLTNKIPVPAYDTNGKKVSDIPVAYKITVALLGNRLTPLTVKIEGSADPLPKITEQDIENSCRGENGADFIYVSFKNAAISLYSIGGNMVMSGKADAVQVLPIAAAGK